MPCHQACSNISKRRTFKNYDTTEPQRTRRLSDPGPWLREELHQLSRNRDPTILVHVVLNLCKQQAFLIANPKVAYALPLLTERKTVNKQCHSQFMTKRKPAKNKRNNARRKCACGTAANFRTTAPFKSQGERSRAQGAR